MAGELPRAEEIIAAHERVEERWDLKYRGTSVAAARLKFKRLLEEIETYDRTYLRAAHLLRDIATAHYFEDGNKRTAWLVMRNYLDEKGEAPAETGEKAERVMLRIRRYEAEELAEWLQTGNIDEDRLSP